MSKLRLEALMTIQTLAAKRMLHTQIARILGVTEGAVRYRLKRMKAGAVDGRSRQESLASVLAAAIEHWRSVHEQEPLNLVPTA
jgi:predicted transcriptional regulator